MRAFSAEPSGGGSSSPASRSSRSSAAAAEKAAPGQSAAGSSSKERLRRYEITRITRPTGNQPAPVVVRCITSKVSTAFLQPRYAARLYKPHRSGQGRGTTGGIIMRRFIFTVAVLAAAMLSGALAQGELRLFLPVQEVDNLGKSRLQSDAAGGIHIVAPSIVGNGFTYMYCPPGCSDEQQLQELRFETDSNGPEVALALDPAGRPHVVIGDYFSLSYAYCSGDCSSAAGWQRGLLTSWEQPDWQISGDSLAIGPDGQAHFLLHGRSELFSDSPHSTWYYS